MTGLLRGIERRGVELLVEKGATLISETVEPVVDALQQPVLNQFRAPRGRVLTAGATKVADSLRGKVAAVPDQLQDRVVGRGHPLRALTHLLRRLTCGAHRFTDRECLSPAVNQSIPIRRISLNKCQQSI